MKNKILPVILSLVFIISCKSEKPVIIKGINYKKAIVGKWQATKLGLIMEQFKYGLPSRLEFKKNEDYYWMYTRFGIRNKRWGEYELDLDKRPVEILFEQEKPKSAILQGIIRFADLNTIHIIFYYKNLMSRVFEFKEKEYQIFKRVASFKPQN
jgi:hypothetical protein